MLAGALWIKGRFEETARLGHQTRYLESIECYNIPFSEVTGSRTLDMA
jgi:hypothetical protein